MVSPDGHLVDRGSDVSGLEGKLGEGSVVIESGHGSEVSGRDIGSVGLANKGVSVSGVSDNNGLGISGAVVVDGFTDINKDCAVVLEEISTFHSRATRLGSNEEVVVNILEGGGKVAGNNNLFEEGEGAIVEFSLDTLEDLFLEGEIEQVEDNLLVFTQELATILRHDKS